MPIPSSCNPQEPFIKLEDVGQAAILNYNLPQRTSFEFKGIIPLKFTTNVFKSDTANIPANNGWAVAAGKTVAQLEPLVMNDLSATVGGNLVTNPKAIKITAGSQKLEVITKGSKIDNVRLADPIIGPPIDELATVTPARVTKEATAMATMLSTGHRPLMKRNFYGTPSVSYVKEPSTVNGQLFIIQKYKTNSYLGDYGAGKTLKTFTLLPGEKTQITVRSFKHVEETRTRSENVIDSFSVHSASELENMVEHTNNAQMAFSTEMVEASEFGGGLSVNIEGVVELGGGGGKTNTNTTNMAMQAVVGKLESALEKHVNESSQSREIEISTDVSVSSTTENETTIVREIENPNWSRVLNFVYRQLLQEYITITYLEDIALFYTNGYPESSRVGKLHEIDEFLGEIVEPADLANVRDAILTEICNIYDHTGTRQVMFEQHEEEIFDPVLTTLLHTNTYWRKKPEFEMTAEGFTVPGIIFRVTRRILRTDSVVTDALLGQGEALDCYNMKLQDAAAIKAETENLILQQQKQIIEELPSEERPDAYKKVFGNCCPGQEPAEA